jgi:tRNA (cmo5U34)-methyltransferase
LSDVHAHFESEAAEFDQLILRLIPHYATMVTALVAGLPFEAERPIRVIDLGCGTGTISLQIKRHFPNSRLTCLDFSENMLSMARRKLAACSGVSFVHGDFAGFPLADGYDAVVSSLALHHAETDSDKIGLYRRIHDALEAGGMFVNADVVLGSSEPLQQANMAAWREFMRRACSPEEVENRWIANYHREDRPARLTDHLSWLSSCGFTGVDVLWKYYNFAVYGGRK